MKEEWKDIPGYEGYYMASNKGRIKSLPRFYNRIRGKKTFKVKVRGRILKPTISNSYGYEGVALHKNGKQKSYYIHQLVAMAFLNYELSGHRIVVHHIDNNGSNNDLSNLEVISNRENIHLGKTNKYSKHIGVSFCKRKKKFESAIYVDGKKIRLGYFPNEEDAAKAYTDYLKKIRI